MSKRFGRNQRRRAREQIAQQDRRIENLLAANARDLELLVHQGGKLRELECEIAAAKDIVGSMCVIFPSELHDFINMPAQEMIYTPGRIPDHVKPDEEIPNSSLTFKKIPLDVMLSSIDEANLRTLSESVHIKVRFRGGQYAYAISDSAWNLMRNRQDKRWLISELAASLAPLILAKCR